jgi:hypothetical protein
MKAPSTNIQAPEKLQIPNPKDIEKASVGIGAWCLMFVWSLDVGAWNFLGGSSVCV